MAMGKKRDHVMSDKIECVECGELFDELDMFDNEICEDCYEEGFDECADCADPCDPWQLCDNGYCEYCCGYHCGEDDR